jgi:hypothetical protein
MSGGRFEYIQYRFSEIAETIESEISRSSKPKTTEEIKAESWRGPEWYERYPEDLNHHEYSPEVLDEFKKGVMFLKMAQIYTHRIDRLLSGDDGDDTFLERLSDDLEDYAQSEQRKSDKRNNK